MLKDMAVVFIRISTIFPLVLFVTLFMGRRSIAEMPVFDFLVILALGSVVGADIADPKINHVLTGFAILLIGIMQRIFSTMVIRISWFNKMVNFEPVIVIYQGKMIHKNLKKAKYSIDNILQMLRENNIYNETDVHLAVMESNGKLNVLEKTNTPTAPSISYPIIKEGKINKSILTKLKLKESWLQDQLHKENIQLSQIFLATIDDQHILNTTKYNEVENQSLPPIYQ